MALADQRKEGSANNLSLAMGIQYRSLDREGWLG